MTSPRPDEAQRGRPLAPEEAPTLVPPGPPRPTTPLPPTAARATPPSAAIPDGVNVPGYEILGVLGRGGMGVVYKARQVQLNRLVALKMVLAGDHAGEAERARFFAEAQAVACLQHPNIVQIYDISEADGRPYFSLEFCAGGSLASRLDGTPWPADRAAALIETLARAVEAAHQAGIIHRDLKPGNVLLVPPRRAGATAHISLAELAARPTMADFGVPKISDFGVAKRLDGSDAKTVTGAVVGTPSYMAPEQTGGAGQTVGPATDVYALGAILYELVTGRPPFKGAAPIDTVMQVLADDPVPPRRLQPKIPRDLETICLKCLHKQQRKRYATAEALADDLKRFLEGKPISARPTPFWERGAKWAKRRPTAAALVAVTVLASSGAALVNWKEARERRETKVTNLIRLLQSSDSDVEKLHGLLAELEPLRAYADPQLLDVARDRNQDPGRRLRAYLALSTVDAEQMEYLSWRLLDCSLREFPLVRERLKPYAAARVGLLFDVLHDPDQPDAARFRAGLALADYAPDDSNWQSADFAFLAGQLLSEGRGDQRDVREYLRPVRGRLLASLESAFHDDGGRTTTRLAAADALADLARDDHPRLARLASEATAEQYAPLRAALSEHEDTAAVRAVLWGILREPVAPSLNAAARVRSGRRRAGAAITLLYLGDVDAAREVLRVHDDPEAATQFIHGLHDRGVGARDVLNCLEGNLSTDEVFGLLLALGGFAPTDLPPPARDGIHARLVAWHRDDPRSAVHAASGWLLRVWGHGADVDAVARTPRPYEPGREWFVERVGDDFFTFVVFQPGDFLAGSPAGEPFRRPNEAQHRVRITRRFALCDRELTAAQYARFAAAAGLPTETDEPPAGGEFPASAMTWAEAVLYCHWLTSAAGMTEENQCYDAAGPPAQVREKLLREAAFRPGCPGYRLPTEAEWEYACRAGTTTAYGFGNDRGMLAFYGRHLQDGATPGGLLRPNRRGLFDMHGNVWEWCHDRYVKRPLDAPDPVGPAAGHNRVLRGGGWDRGPWHCRSAYRHSPTPDYRGSYMGFRLARTLP